jgi:hypothetical protein
MRLVSDADSLRARDYKRQLGKGAVKTSGGQQTSRPEDRGKQRVGKALQPILQFARGLRGFAERGL